ncbi:MAG: N-formylglutamate amidohydrolase [Pseudomonadota bacterium]
MQRNDPCAPFDVLHPPALCSGVVFASPHSGTCYDTAFLKQSSLDPHTIRSSEDAYVDVLFQSAVTQGCAFLVAHTPRAYVDLNRAADELDPALITGVKRHGVNPRVIAGLGVIPRVVAAGRAIYRGKLSLHEAHHRLNTHWRPYHAKLQNILDQAHATFGQTLLIDCHSMPHEAINPNDMPRDHMPEIVLGDRFGAAAGRTLVDRIEAAFHRAGFRVARNAPFAGAYIAQQYGRPSRGQHVVQVEIDRSLYMDEISLAPLPEFAHFQNRLQPVISDIANLIRAQDYPMAAE